MNKGDGIISYCDVCFRLVSYYNGGDSEVSSVLNEFAAPATWKDGVFDNPADIISDAQEYIAELMACNCFHPVIGEDSVIVMDGDEVVEVYYGFVAVEQQYDESMCIEIPEQFEFYSLQQCLF